MSFASSSFCCVTPGPTDSISKLAWNTADSKFIATSNWDGKVRVYQQHDSDSFVHVAAAATHANLPALCVDWHSDGTSLFTCGGDNAAVQCRLESGAIAHTPVAKHSAPIKSLTWWAETGLLVTGGFDNAMMYWDLRQQQPVHTMVCPGKVQCVASKGATMVMTCVNNAVGDATCKSAVYAFDKSSRSDNIRSIVADTERSKLSKGQKFTPTHASPACLSYQIRSIGMMRNGEGWALGSSEGRVVVENRADADVPADWPHLDTLFSSMTPKPRGPVRAPHVDNVSQY
jgi:mRNA export factor